MAAHRATVVSLVRPDKRFLLVRIQMEPAAAEEVALRAAALAQAQQRVAQIQGLQETLRVQDQEAVLVVDLVVVWEPEEELARVVQSELEAAVVLEAAAVLEAAVALVAVNNLPVVIVESIQVDKEATVFASKSLMRPVASRATQTNMSKMTMATISRVVAGKT